MGKLHSGYLLQVDSDNFAADKAFNNGNNRKQLIARGEIIEITIAYEWHFRLMDGEHFVADESYIMEHCRLFGQVIDIFELRGKINLEQIIRWRFWNKRNLDKDLEIRELNRPAMLEHAMRSLLSQQKKEVKELQGSIDFNKEHPNI